jgi:hypothetical protein
LVFALFLQGACFWRDAEVAERGETRKIFSFLAEKQG